MTFIVVYQRADGSAGVEECGDLDLAIVTAERLRNVDAVERPRIFKTEEIRYDFRPYYRVEVMSEDSADDSEGMTPPSGTQEVEPAPVVETAVEPEVVYEPQAPVTPSESVERPASADQAAGNWPPPPLAGSATQSPVAEDADSGDAAPDGVVEHASVGSDVPSPTETVVEASTESDADVSDAVVEVEEQDSRGGLFSKGVGERVANAVEGASDEEAPEPPRRGLFGR